MDVKIASDWKEILSEEFEKPYFRELTDFVRQEYASRRIFPRGSNIFRAFDKCPFDKLKVVIIGQDPYHGEGQANGLCFSVADGVPFPPSLQNIFQEVADDTGSPIPTQDTAGKLSPMRSCGPSHSASKASFTCCGEVTPSAKAPSPIPSATASSKPSIPPRCRPTGDFSAANTFPGPTNICKASERHRFCGKHNNF